MADFLHLALDTSTSRPAVALLKGRTPLREWMGPEGLRHHETLLAGVDQVLKEAELQLADLTYLSVGVGPGLFTGLRIGLVTAKFLAEPLNLPCVAVSSLMALAHQSGLLEERTVWAVSDAKSHRVYALRLRPGELAPDYSAPPGEEIAVSPEEAATQMQAGDWLIGEGALLYRSLWPAGVSLADEADHALRASSVGAVGHLRYNLGLISGAADIQPTYLKTGQAHL